MNTYQKKSPPIDRERIVKCTLRGCGRRTKAGIRLQRISRHNELGAPGNLISLYFASTSSAIGEQDVRIYNKVRDGEEHAIEPNSWPAIWKDTGRADEERYD